MVEPVASTATGTFVFNIGTISLVGMWFGMPAEALLFGFFGAIGRVLARKEQATRIATFSFIFIGVLLAGTISPFLANAIYVNVGWLGFVASQMIQNTIALVIGALWQWLMPHIWELICSLVSRFIAAKTKKDVEND